MAQSQGIGVPGSSQPAVASILDTDLYKARLLPPSQLGPALTRACAQLTMQNAVLHKFPDMEVTYQFTNRNGHKQPFTRRCYERVRKMVDGASLPSGPRPGS